MRSFGVFDPVVTDTNDGVVGVGEELMGAWNQIRKPVIVPGLRIAVYACAVMSLMLLVERVYMAFVILCVKVLGRKRYMKYNIDGVMEEMQANRSHPMVLVQVPMYNEKEVYKLSIGAACKLKWPADRIIIQVLDDSTDPGYLLLLLCDLPSLRFSSRSPCSQIDFSLRSFDHYHSQCSVHSKVCTLNGKLVEIGRFLESISWSTVLFCSVLLRKLLYLVYCGIFDIMYGRDYFWVYLFLQAGAFFVVGIGYIGTVVPT